MVELERLQEFFFWCMVVNSGIYAFTAIAVFTQLSVDNLFPE